MKHALAVVIFFCFLGVFALSAKSLYENFNQSPEAFSTTKPEIKDIIVKAVIGGKIVPQDEITIKSLVSGIVEQIYFKIGDSVSEGSTIAKVRIVPDSISLNFAKNDLRQAKINLEKAEYDLQTFRDLLEKKIIHKKEYEQYVFKHKLQLIQYEAAARNVELVEKGSSLELESRSNLIRSTKSGILLEIPVKVGDSVVGSAANEGTTVASIASLDEMVFQSEVIESDVGKMAKGMEIDVEIIANEGESYTGIITNISPKGVENDGIVKFLVEAEIVEGNKRLLRAGYSATATIVLQHKRDVLTIEESMLRFEAGKPFIEIETQPQVFQKQFIEVGISDGFSIEVLFGLNTDSSIKM